MTIYLAGAKSSYGDTSKGDQNELEVCVHQYNNYWHEGVEIGYKAAYRYNGGKDIHENCKVRNRMIRAAVNGANNNNIGYAMDETRITSYNLIKAKNWKPAAMKTLGKCNTDCSEYMAICVNCGLGKEAMRSDTWTKVMNSRLKALGFDKITNINFSTGSGLMPGDIVLEPDFHTEIYIGNQIDGEYYIKEFKTAGERYLYTEADSKDPDKRIMRIPEGSILTYLHYKTNTCYKVSFSDKIGWVHARGNGAVIVRPTTYE